jgi:hypothetical protein
MERVGWTDENRPHKPSLEVAREADGRTDSVRLEDYVVLLHRPDHRFAFASWVSRDHYVVARLGGHALPVTEPDLDSAVTVFGGALAQERDGLHLWQLANDEVV